MADIHTVMKALAAQGAFVSATCKGCGRVKRPLVDVADDDGAPCVTCDAEFGRALRVEAEVHDWLTWFTTDVDQRITRAEDEKGPHIVSVDEPIPFKVTP